MLYKVCEDFDQGRCGMHSASMLKLHTSESKVQNSLAAVQIWGAYGYVKESPPEKQMRDSLASKLYSGTSEMQKKIMLEGLGKGMSDFLLQHYLLRSAERCPDQTALRFEGRS